jgi:hypothetical protein
MKKIIYFLCLISFFSISCRKPEKVSIIPEIKFISVPTKDTADQLGNPIRRASLNFSLIDGDGDIGLNDYDTVSPYNPGSVYYNNIYIDLYTKVNGQMTLIPLQTPFYFRTPYIQPKGIDKVLQCTIKVDMDFILPVSWDSCEFVFYMYDRAQHKSNVVSSGYRKLAP